MVCTRGDCNSFQLTHMPHGNHAQLFARAMATKKEDKTLLQHSQLSQHGEFWHVSVTTAITAVWSESSYAFPKNGTATGSRWSARVMAANGETKSPPPR